jgi:branched-chain amino acid transport system substrate-binding protein
MNIQGQENPRVAVFFLALFVLGGLFLTGCESPAPACADPLGCIVVERREPVRIGAITALSGDAAVWGKDVQWAVELALTDRGSALLDHPLELVVVDSGCGAEVGEVAAKLVIEDEDVLGIVGPLCTEAAETAVPIVEAAGLTIISPAASAGWLTGPERQPAFFRTIASDTTQAQITAVFAYDQLNARTAAIIYDETDVNNALHEAFAGAFRELGGQITFQSSIAPGDSNVVEILRGAGAASPDVLYLPVFEPEGNLIVNRIADIAGLQEVVLLGGNGLFSDSFAQGVGNPIINGMYVVGPVAGGSAYDAFLARWHGRYNQPPAGPFHTQAYDAANILLDAIETVALEDNNGGLLIGLQALRDTIGATSGYAGVSGELTCSAAGDCAAPDSLGVYQIGREEINGTRWPPPLVWTPLGDEVTR